MDDKELIKFPDDPLGAAIQNFALYARGEGSFDELDLKEAIFALHEADKQRAVRDELEEAVKHKQGYIPEGYGVDRTREAVPVRYFENRLAKLSKEYV